MTPNGVRRAWQRGRLDAGTGRGQVLFGHMYEDAAIELSAFPPAGRVFCIASAGCTALQLAPHHEVVAVDVNPAQLSYAERRFAGEPAAPGMADWIPALGRACGPLVGWRASRLRAFVELEDTAEQVRYWLRHLDTRRFQLGFRLMLARPVLRLAYAAAFLDLLPADLAGVLRGRMKRCFGRHANRTNPYARALLLGEWPEAPVPAEAKGIRTFRADAADHLEDVPAGSFDGFALSNILDGAEPAYERRLLAAVKRAASPEAVVVQRSFRQPRAGLRTNRADDDRSMLWGIVDVRPAAQCRERAGG